MKKLFVWVIALIFPVGTALAADDKPIDFNELPAVAQQFVQKYFANDKVFFVTKDSDFFGREYKVFFTTRSSIEFDNSGNWREVECKSKGVPAGVVPAAIEKTINQKFPTSKVISIEKNKALYDVELDNSAEMTFDAKGKIVKYDD